MVIITTMCKLLVALLLGYYLNKKDILNAETSKRLSSIIVNYILPFMILSSVAGIEGDRGEVLILFLVGVVSYCIFPIVALILIKVLRVPVNLKGTYMCMLMFSNNSFMGFPVVSALFGSQAIFYCTIYHMLFNLTFFSLGMILIRRDASADQQSGEGTATSERQAVTRAERRKMIRQVINNGVITSVLALIIYFCNIPMPQMVAETCSFIGSVCMPMSMLVIGSSIAGYPLRELFTEKRVYLVAVFRLILIPFLTYLGVRMVISNAMIVSIITITVGMPIASVVAMGSAPFKEQGKAASIAVVFTTLCSMITIPIMCLLLGA